MPGIDAKKVWIIAGGSYNPITAGHFIMMDTVREKCQAMGYTVDRGYFSPVPDAYRMNKPKLLDASVRAKMVALACSDSWLQLHDWEWRQHEFVRTRVLLDHIQEEAGPDVKLFFACGADLIDSMAHHPSWSPEDVCHLLKKYVFVVVERTQASADRVAAIIGSEPHMAPGRETIVVTQPTVENDISSTMIRDAMRERRPLSGLVHPAVAQYIVEHGLYSE
ncbi:putative nicotinate-nucleotide adenylyltransferase [Carpediemonas membranifera]|uniref:Nicotinamide-nucleotide adenylyltransferase n=1 Tax=Carpediemonas membranifera TaxID=201153 RepID=A0A8J6AQK2_9EUKA|nr:putative nicotinate-nucleotide adenylyltransferase [Carpediemonas membranifera]|eukprot:KAG9391138.1 putative nicotinate-nucleotide adenylyltransferase [Carpediemonas membranifera]